MPMSLILFKHRHLTHIPLPKLIVINTPADDFILQKDALWLCSNIINISIRKKKKKKAEGEEMQTYKGVVSK